MFKLAPVKGLTPTNWVILDIVDLHGNKFRKIFSVDRTGRDWRLSSHIVDRLPSSDEYIAFKTNSGSEYLLNPAERRMTEFMQKRLDDWVYFTNLDGTGTIEVYKGALEDVV